MENSPISPTNRPSFSKNVWRRDTCCFLCHNPFGVVGLVYFKKYYCKFCMHGICAKCSAVGIDLQDPRKIELICKRCFQSNEGTLKEEIKVQAHELFDELDKIQKEITEVNQKIDQKSAKLSLYVEKLAIEEKIFDDSQIEISIEHFRKDKIELKEKLEKLKAEISEVCDEIDEKESVYFESEIIQMETKNKLEIDKKKAAELYRTLATKQDENTKLQKELDSIIVSPLTKAKSEKQIAREENLRKAYKKLIEEEQFYTSENIKLLEEINYAESDVTEKDEILKKTHENLEGLPKNADIEEKALNELNKNLEEQQKLIKQFKTEIETERKKIEPIVNKSCGNCVIY